MQSLNLSQKQAIKTTEGPLLILAGAGTGKTKVLINRIAYIIENNFAHPSEILAITFTNKAAEDMKSRIDDVIASSSGLNIGTFHSIAAKMLRSHIYLLDNGMHYNFSIINQDDQIKLVKNIALQTNIDIKKYTPKLLHIIISNWKDMGLSLEKLQASDLLTHESQIAYMVYKKYQKNLQEINVADFGDLLLYSNHILAQHSAILRYYQTKFKYILVDEYQDTNTAQYIWVRILSITHKNICCVGDDDQSIYSWRGAEVENILNFKKDFSNAKIIKLEENYRSSPYILKAASSIIKNNKNRYEKNLWTKRKSKNKIKIITCRDDKEESMFIVNQIKRYINSQQYNANQIAILVRVGFQTRLLEKVFINKATPYHIIGGVRFYERMEIKNLLSYIRLAINKNNNLAFERIINVPKRSVGSVTIKKIKNKAAQDSISSFEALQKMIEHKDIKGKIKDNLQRFVYTINRASERYKIDSAFDVTKFILDESGYLSELKEKRTKESQNRIENINEMLRGINEVSNIQQFIETTSLVMDNDYSKSNFSNAVKIMTLHASKGLEFDVVFLAGWEEGIFPHQKTIATQGTKGMEEERRIAYVGITRAKQELFITYAKSRRVFSEVLNYLPSRFLKEIPSEICTKILSSDQLSQLDSRYDLVIRKSLCVQ